MAHTAEERDHLATPLCQARKKNGESCRAFAGQGTDHKGIGACKNHGGSMQTHKKNAAKVRAEQQLAKLGKPLPVTPAQLMMGHVHLAAGYLEFLTGMVNELDEADHTTPEGRAVIRMWVEERKLGPHIAKMAADMGVSERMTSLAEAQTEQVSRLIEAIADDLDFTAKQKRALGPAVRRQIALTQNGDGNVIDGKAKGKAK